MRYGVLVDLARKVRRGEPIDLAMGYINVIWQGDANAMALASFDHAAMSPFVLNVTGPEVLRVRRRARAACAAHESGAASSAAWSRTTRF